MPKTDKSKDPMSLRLSPGVLDALDKLAGVGIHGSNRTEVARYLIIRGLDEMRRDGYFNITKE